MNSLKRFMLVSKLYQSREKHYSLKTITALGKEREKPFDNRLQTRFRKFLENNFIEDSKKSQFVEDSKIQAETHETSDVIHNYNLSSQNNSTDYDRLVASIEKLYEERSSNVTKSLELIDNECCRLLGILTKTQIFRLWHSLLRSDVNVPQLKMFRSSLLALQKHLEKDGFSTNEKLQLFYFEGLGKKPSKKRMKFLANFLPPMRELSLMEKCIVADAAFKCTMSLKEDDARSLEELLEKKAAELVRDHPLLSTVCKALTRAGTSSRLCLKNLTTELIRHDKIISIMNSARILNLYVKANRRNEILTERLFGDSMTYIIKNNRYPKGNYVRIKDVDRLLWACGVLNYRFGEQDAKEISIFVDRRLKEFQAEPFLLVNILLALRTLDYPMYKVVRKCLKDRLFEIVNEQKERWKPAARLHLLLNIIKIESPEIELPDELLKPHKVGMEVSKSVRRLRNIVKGLETELEMQEVIIDCPIDGIYIAGVSLRGEDKSIHIDLLNETTCFKGTNFPHGLTSLKLRLLAKIGFHSVSITEDQLENPEGVLSTVTKSIAHKKEYRGKKSK